MRGLFVAFVVLISQALSAQEYAFEFWHEGKIVLETGDTLKGSVKYDMQSDLLQFEVNKRYESYTARKVLFFEIFDQTVKNYRQFYSLPYSTGGSYKAPVFFELLCEGKITLLSRERLEYRTYNSGFYYNSTYTRMVLVNKYYLLRDNGNIEEFIGSKKSDWLELMRPKSDDIEKYAKSNRLDFDQKNELSTIVSYYNSLFKNNN
jgi:hypothetical protein